MNRVRKTSKGPILSLQYHFNITNPIRYSPILFALVTFILSIDAFAADINLVRVSNSLEKTRLVLELSETAKFSSFTLENPSRLVVDISDTNFKVDLKEIDFSKTPIANLRYSERNKKDLRLVFDLRAKVSSKIFLLGASEGSQNRLVIDLTAKMNSVSKTLDNVLKRTNPKIVIAIDAGHGGRDPGASGPNRLREKSVVLDIAKKIEKLFDNNPYFDGVLVRTGDYYIDHRKRTAIAREKRADFFISIHADGFSDPRAYGASVYALSTKGATSEAARFLASSQNRADLIGGANDLNLDNVDPVAGGILVDLLQTESLKDSLDAGNYVLRNLGTVARLHKKKVEQAAFLVLKSPDIPSLLIETGFISNPKEAKQLSSNRYQQRISQAIYDGLYSFYLERPPIGTSLSANSGKLVKIYVVSSGDTLSEIAQSNKTSVSKILRYNNLDSKSIRIGQKISIPPN